MSGLLIKVVLVTVGGGAGALMRFGMNIGAEAALGSRFPMGTLLANVIGCLLAGVFGYFYIEKQAVSEQARLLLVTGFLGGLTTFSSFGLETMILGRQSAAGLAALNIAANVVLSLLGVWGGWSGARALWH